MTITAALRTEHQVFCRVFAQVESVLDRVTTVAEVRVLAEVVKGLLSQHGKEEDDVLYPALDQILGEQQALAEMFEQHRELDDRLDAVCAEAVLEDAVHGLREVMRAMRRHFSWEEQVAFPLAEQKLSPGALACLENAAHA